MKYQKFSILKRLKSFKFAFEGLKTLFVEEHNARIHLVATVIVVLLGIFYKISTVEWVVIILSIGFVLAMEALNSAIENLADFVSPNKHPLIKKVKDLSAGGVFISALTALVVGCIVFLPKIIKLL